MSTVPNLNVENNEQTRLLGSNTNATTPWTKEQNPWKRIPARAVLIIKRNVVATVQIFWSEIVLFIVKNVAATVQFLWSGIVAMLQAIGNGIRFISEVPNIGFHAFFFLVLCATTIPLIILASRGILSSVGSWKKTGGERADGSAYNKKATIRMGTDGACLAPHDQSKAILDA
ncbi:hypothetical protein OPT61_g5745 [Boeremia exigua]|uniref:Uncharacterized protein n=1 Tax=Boeremia exigua TaxID=749465 RepID=A0ACC2I9A0_9PLEO|nr:hypothetical protein OPT61_g5745 [Boeremia exigua]